MEFEDCFEEESEGGWVNAFNMGDIGSLKKGIFGHDGPVGPKGVEGPAFFVEGKITL